MLVTDDRVRVVVLTGTGTTFCADFDLKEFAQPDLARTEIKFSGPPGPGERDCDRASDGYLTSSAGVTFREAFEVEHDRVFDEFLLGVFGPGPGA
jgi:enoyl-CoA hydratase/carnithine racemase